MVKLLIAITSWSRTHGIFLSKLLDTYAAEYADLAPQICLSVNYAFEHSLPHTRLTKEYEGWRYTWNCRRYELESDWTHLIESDDDILVPRRAFDYYVKLQGMPAPFVPGVVSYEQDAAGSARLITLASDRPPVKQMMRIEGRACFEPHNPHSGCLIIDRARWDAARPSETPTRSGWFTEAEYARSELYDRAYKKAVEIEAVRDGSALVRHLPARYLLKTWRTCPTPNTLRLKAI